MYCGIARREREGLLGGRERRFMDHGCDWEVGGGRAVDCGIARRERVGLAAGPERERRITAVLVVGSSRGYVGC